MWTSVSAYTIDLKKLRLRYCFSIELDTNWGVSAFSSFVLHPRLSKPPSERNFNPSVYWSETVGSQFVLIYIEPVEF